MEIIYQSLHCHHQNDSRIKPVGSDESHFNVSPTVRDKATRQYPQTTACEDGERRAEAAGSNRGPSAYQRPNALPLGQTGSRVPLVYDNLPWRKVQESDARSVHVPGDFLFFR